MFDHEETEGLGEFHHDLNAALDRYERMLRSEQLYYFDSETLLQMAEFHQTNNMLDKAQEVIRFGLCLHPDDFDLGLKHADLVSLSGNEYEALRLLDELEQKHPGEADIYILRGNICLDLEEYEKAIENFKMAIDYVDEPHEIHISLAYAYRHLNDFEKAELNILKAMAMRGDEIDAAEEFVDLYVSSNQHMRGIYQTDYLIDKDPYNLVAWFARGNLYLLMNDFDQAIESLEYCLAIDDTFVPALYLLASACSALQRYEQAIEFYQRSLRLEMPDAYTYFCMGECYAELKQYNEARSYYRKSARLAPSNSDIYYSIALTYVAQKRWREANHYIRKAIDLNKHVSDYYLVLGDCEFHLNHWSQANDCFIRAVELDRMNRDAWFSYLNFLTATGHYDQALCQCQQALTHHADDAELHYRLAAYLFLNKKNKEAYIVFRKAFQMSPAGYSILFEINPGLIHDSELKALIANEGIE
jgi:tetratricopeptide (TPR) repeat protein